MKKIITQEDWNACIKVLKILSRNPEEAIDVTELKGLVTKLHKRAKKDNKINTLVQKINKISASDSSINLPIHKIQKVIFEQDILKQYDQKLLSKTVLHQQNPLDSSNSDISELNTQNAILTHYKSCYVCNGSHKEVHFFYHLLCPKCAKFNFEKRSQSTDLTGRIALITGGRIKIGYLTALRMLRDGAKVWVTTRFPKDCIRRFSKETDFEEWSQRLKVIALDLRNIENVYRFINYFKLEEPHLDILIHNAAQTIKRPPAFYQHLSDFENQPINELPIALQNCLLLEGKAEYIDFTKDQFLLPKKANLYFPEGKFDKDEQQIDLREANSWTSLLSEVSPIEMVEVQFVNVTSPFMMNGMLKPLFLKSPFERKFIVNVSAMEGQFNRSSKTPFHPHTNMAKAALNMMTRTSAQEYAQEGIYMNSVDTGWITQENPHPKKQRLREEGFVPPLDEIDGMARIYDPIARGINESQIPLFGHFLKDYFPYIW
jgi:NAD(P)-dependent dehydrogenase (short-subunit alcohol dehydrogenase family)